MSISDSQREPVRQHRLRWAATVYNGLDLGRYRADPGARADDLAFVGRISPEKGPDLAIEVARRTGRPLKIAAKVDPVDVEYFAQVVEPELGGVGGVRGRDRRGQQARLLRHAPPPPSSPATGPSRSAW